MTHQLGPAAGAFGEAFSLVVAAVTADEECGNNVEAVYYEAIECLLEVLKEEDATNRRDREQIREIVSALLTRVEALKGLGSSQVPNKGELMRQLCNLGMSVAMTLDESRRNDEKAAELYLLSVEQGLNSMKLLPDETAKKLRSNVKNMIERAENIKKKRVSADKYRIFPKANFGIQKISQLSHKRGSQLTESEKKVLRNSSNINGLLFLPWAEVDAKEKHQLKKPFEDPDGLLELSQKQRDNMHAWRRPSEFMRTQPKMIELLSAYSVKQTIISDCSFVSSLTVAAIYERRFNRRLITNCIYPQDKTGKPLYNPSGKYTVRLTINGIKRKVVIDDRFPVDQCGNLLCSHSTNKSELWVSIMEKAFLKVNGGYQFPGSNSGVDLHVLCGWIPENIVLEKCDAGSLWNRIRDGLYLGQCLVTVSTGALNSAQEEATGLSDRHAYAVLGVKQVKGHKLVQVKNPWTRSRWKGKFSENDKVNWTKELQKAVGFDLLGATMCDNGIFWIDWDSLRSNFERLHISWNPRLFPYRDVAHSCWTKIGADRQHYSRNPQYLVTVNAPAEGASLWLLLSSHSTKKLDINDLYITLHVYDAPDYLLGDQAFYPEDDKTPSVWKGTYINSPHSLARVNVPRGQHRYFAVVSTYDTDDSLSFTLNAYCSHEMTFKIIPVLPHSEKVNDEFDGSTAGGSSNSRQFFANPQYLLKLKDKGRVVITMEVGANTNAALNLRCLKTKEKVQDYGTLKSSTVMDSGVYRPHFCYVAEVLEAGEYVLVPSTFDPGQLYKYIMRISSSSKLKVTRIQ